MTVSPTLKFSGKDELLVLPVSDTVRSVTVSLPENGSATSKLVTMEKLVSNKWAEPQPNHRLITTTPIYIAYAIPAKNSTATMVKIMDKEDFGRRTIIKDIKGKVVQFLFKTQSGEGDGDELFALVSVEESGALHLAIYDIIVTDAQALQNNVLFKGILTENVPPTITPALAIQPQDEEVNVVGVAVNNTIYMVQTEEEKETKVDSFQVDLKSEIVSMYIADNEDATIASCSKNGTIAFHIPETKEKLEEYDIYEDEPSTAYWMGFPDDHTNEDQNPWGTVIVAGESCISILSLKFWKISYSIKLQYPGSRPMGQFLRYNLDSRGRYLVLSSSHAHQLYILELGKTQEAESPDLFTRMFCYPVPVTGGIYDLSINCVTHEESVPGRYESETEMETISLIGISTTNAMYNWKAVFNCGFKDPASVSGMVENVAKPATPNPKAAAKSAAASPKLLSPGAFAAAGFSNISISSLPTPGPFNTSTTGIKSNLSAPGDFTTLPANLPGPDAFTMQPKSVPKSEAFLEKVGGEDDLMPTPLSTPAESRRRNQDEDICRLISQIPIDEQEAPEALRFEAHVADKLKVRCADDEFSADFIEFYNSCPVNFPELHPSLCNQILAKYLIRAALRNPVVIRELAQQYPTFGEDLRIVLESLVRMLLMVEAANLALSHFSSVCGVVSELYLHGVPDSVSAQNLVLVVLEFLIKSHYEREDGDSPQGLWEEFLAANIKDLTEVVKRKDSKNQGFLIQVKNVIEPLLDILPSNISVEIEQSESRSKLLQIIQNSSTEAPPPPPHFTEPSPDFQEASAPRFQEASAPRFQEASAPRFQEASAPRFQSVLSLLEYLDQEVEVSFEHVTEFLKQLMKEEEGASLEDVVGAIVGNYYPKTWYESLLLYLSNEIPTLRTALLSSLKTRLNDWYNRCHVTATPTSYADPEPLTPGLYSYSHGSSPLQFYMQRIEQKPRLRLITSTLLSVLGSPGNQNTSSRDVSRDFKENDLVACFTGYDTWQRGEVVSVYDEDDIRVTLVDTGELIQTNRECLRALPLFRNIAGKAYCARLGGISCPDEHLDSVMEYFKNVISRSGDLQVTPSREKGVVSVILGNGTDLAQKLCQQGHALWTNEVKADTVSHKAPLKGVYPSELMSEEALRIPSLDNGDVAEVARVAKHVQLYGKEASWMDLGEELKDIMCMQVRRVLKKEDPIFKAPSRQSPASAPISSETEELTDQRLVSRDLAVSRDVTSVSSRDVTPPSSVPDAVFAAQDIREMNRVSYIDSRTKGSLKKVNRGLTKALQDIRLEAKSCKITREDVDGVVHSAASARACNDSDLKECASRFYDVAFSHLHRSLEQFYQNEFLKKLQVLYDQMMDSQEKLKSQTFINDKMESVIKKDVTQIVRVVNEEVQRSLINGLSVEDTLNRQIQDNIIPSFRSILDGIYLQFTAVLSNEMNAYTGNLAGASNEAELLSKLQRIDDTLAALQRSHEQTRRDVQYFCSKVEQDLNKSVQELYSRHHLS